MSKRPRKPATILRELERAYRLYPSTRALLTELRRAIEVERMATSAALEEFGKLPRHRDGGGLVWVNAEAVSIIANRELVRLGIWKKLARRAIATPGKAPGRGAPPRGEKP